jgi:hypothetical protein
VACPSTQRHGRSLCGSSGGCGGLRVIAIGVLAIFAEPGSSCTGCCRCRRLLCTDRHAAHDELNVIDALGARGTHQARDVIRKPFALATTTSM